MRKDPKDSEFQCVLITQKINSQKSTNTFGNSGILLSNEWILTHGSFLSPNFFDSTCESTKICDFLSNTQESLEKDLVHVPREVSDSLKIKVQLKVRDGSMEESTVEDCSIKYVWRCPLLRKSFNGLLFSWNFDKTFKYDKSLQPIFLLLRIGNNDNSDHKNEGKRVLRNFYNQHCKYLSELRRGLDLEIISTPFGNPIFLDSVSRGIVSNILGNCNSLILTDANVVPGSEGAPVFLLAQWNQSAITRRICGIVIATGCWCRGERVDYTFAANLQICIGKLLNILDNKLLVTESSSFDRCYSDSLFLADSIDRSLVAVECGSGWGTGFVVDATNGIILTCSHVVREAPDSRVQISMPNIINTKLRENKNVDDCELLKIWAKLVYRTRDGEPYDIAVLKLEDFSGKYLKTLELVSEIPDQGTEVLTAGFPFFPSLPASYSRGIISRSTFCMLQTTCTVQSGASGGPVIDYKSGRVLGLIVSNAVSTDTKILYPRFNMAVPASALRKPILEYVATGDATCLEKLSSIDPVIENTWKFNLTPRSKM